MEVATDGIYFIIYVTYIIVTTTCFALSSVLYLTKGIKTPLSNNKSYIKGKNLIATGILMEGFVHLLMFITSSSVMTIRTCTSLSYPPSSSSR